MFFFVWSNCASDVTLNTIVLLLLSLFILIKLFLIPETVSQFYFVLDCSKKSTELVVDGPFPFVFSFKLSTVFCLLSSPTRI